MLLASVSKNWRAWLARISCKYIWYWLCWPILQLPSLLVIKTLWVSICHTSVYQDLLSRSWSIDLIFSTISYVAFIQVWKESQKFSGTLNNVWKTLVFQIIFITNLTPCLVRTSNATLKNLRFSGEIGVPVRESKNSRGFAVHYLCYIVLFAFWSSVSQSSM